VHEEEVLYQALSSPLGLVVTGSRAALAKAKSQLAKSDPAILELVLVGPDPSGQLYILRSDQARQNAPRKESAT
jgi:hypothetical protein